MRRLFLAACLLALLGLSGCSSSDCYESRATRSPGEAWAEPWDREPYEAPTRR